MKKLFLEPKKDTPESLMRKGTPVEAKVLKILRKGSKYQVLCTAVDVLMNSRNFIATVNNIGSTRIGDCVTVYVDDIDADNEYYIDIR